MQNEKSGPPMDFTYVRIIIGGTIEKNKIKFNQGGEPSYRAKTVGNWTKGALED